MIATLRRVDPTGVTLPQWLLLVLTVVPAVAALAAVVSAIIAGLARSDGEERWKREETMRRMNWGVHLVGQGGLEAQIGLLILDELKEGGLMTARDRILYDEVLRILTPDSLLDDLLLDGEEEDAVDEGAWKDEDGDSEEVHHG